MAESQGALLTEGMILEAPGGTVLSDHLGRPVPVPSGRAAFELHDYIGQTADGTPIWGGDILDATNTLFPWGYAEFTVTEMRAWGLLRSDI